MQRVNLLVGVGKILVEYPRINQTFSEAELGEITKDVYRRLKPLDVAVDMVFFSGGELTFMRRIGYELAPNLAFSDPLHPFTITREAFQAGE